MRRFTLFIYSALVMLVGGSLLGVSPGAAQVAVSLPDVTARAGTSDTIPITVGDLTGEGVISYDFTISFDESVVELTGVTVDGTLSEVSTPTVNTSTAGVIQVSFATTSALSGDGTLVLLNASYGSAGTSPLTFDVFQFNEGDPVANTDDGTVTVAERAVFIGTDVTGSVGEDDVLIPVMVDELTAADDVISFEFDVTFDPAVIDVTGASASGTLSEGFSVEVNPVAPGQVRIVAAGTTAITGEGTLINLVADLLQAGSSDLTISNLVFNEGTPTLAAIAGRVTVTAAEVFEANLAGYNEAPQPIESDGTGSITASLSDDQLVLTGTFSGLSAPYTASHIHQAPAGIAGGVIIGLTPTLDGDAMGGTYTAANNTFTLTADQITALRAGDLYVNVHSTANPGGEIRGQLLVSPNAAPSAVAITDPAEGATVDVEGDVDATLGISWSASIDPNGDDVYYDPQASFTADFAEHVHLGLTSATSTSVSFGDLNEMLIDEGVSVGESATLFLRANAHDGSERAIGATTSVNLVLGVFPQFGTNLSGVNEVPMTQSVASGSASVSLSGRTLVVTGSFSGLVQTFTASHIHTGPVGVSGGVLIGLTVAVSDDGRSGSFESASNTFDLDAVSFPAGFTADSFIAALEAGNTYVNVHSTAYPGGEIRGQILSSGNVAPAATTITSPANAARVVIQGDPSSTGLAIGFSAATDPDGDQVAYVYQLSADAGFERVVFTEILTDASGFEFTVDDLADIYDSIAEQVVVGEDITVHHRLISTDGSLWTAGASSSLVLERQSPTGKDDPDGLPTVFTIKGNYPNPFNPSTTVRFDLPETADVSVRIVDLLGREVMSVPVRAIQAGANRTLEVDAAALASGTYIYRVVAKGATSTMVDTGTMTLIK